LTANELQQEFLDAITGSAAAISMMIDILYSRRPVVGRVDASKPVHL
jgi:hypothetical protein